MSAIKRVHAAIEELKKGKPCILTDDPDRENEGDLIMPAETMTSEYMNFMIRHGTGIVCLSLTKPDLLQLNLPLMVPADENDSFRGTPFTISIDSKFGITTGVSAADRTKTVLDCVAPHVSAADFVRPGHIYPLQAREGGVLQREGHTEGANDLVRISGFKPAAVLCEVMNADGTMARGSQLNEFAEKHQLCMLSISDIVHYRKRYEDLIAEEVSTSIPLEEYGHLQMTVIREKYTHKEHIVFANLATSHKSTLVRVHSSCITGDMFASKRCDCHAQLHYSLERIRQEGGILIYLNQEGRGIGLFNKIKAYALQEAGLDTVEANEELGLPIDSRAYAIAANVLRNKNITDIRLLTNNPQKIQELIDYGIHSVVREPIPPFHNQYNQFYLQTKKEKLKHVINFD